MKFRPEHVLLMLQLTMELTDKARQAEKDSSMVTVYNQALNRMQEAMMMLEDRKLHIRQRYGLSADEMKYLD